MALITVDQQVVERVADGTVEDLCRGHRQVFDVVLGHHEDLSVGDDGVDAFVGVFNHDVVVEAVAIEDVGVVTRSTDQRVGTGFTVEGVVAGTANQGVVAVTDAEGLIVHGIAQQRVIALTSIEVVVALAAERRVVAATHAHGVVAGFSGEEAAAAVAVNQQVVECVTDAAVEDSGRGQRQVLDVVFGHCEDELVGDDGVDAFVGAFDHDVVVSTVAIEDVGVITHAARQGVSATVAIEGVVAGAADQGVVAAVARQGVVQGIAGHIGGQRVANGAGFDVGSQGDGRARRGEAVDHGVGALPGVFSDDVGETADVVDVVTSTADHGVVAGATVEGVVAVAA